jgi:hypothetical protein
MHKNLMSQVTAKFTYFKVCQIWDFKSPDKEKLIVMIADLKGKLKLAPNLEKKTKKKKDNEAKDKDNERSTRGGYNKNKRTRRTFPTSSHLTQETYCR